MSPADLEAAKLEGKKEPEPWQGLVLVHAQKMVQNMWERFGFKLDEDMGEWDEEGIQHVGLWKRIDIKGRDLSKPLPPMSTMAREQEVVQGIFADGTAM